MGESWGEMTRGTDEAKKEADEELLEANTAKWKLSDSEITMKAEKDRHVVPACQWKESCNM